MTNPLLPLVPALADSRRAAAPPPVSHRWAWVHSTAPLHVRYAAESEPVEVEATPLVPRSALRVGAQVLLFDHGGELIIVGVAASAATAWTPLSVTAPWTTYSAFGEPSWRAVNGAVQLAGTVRDGTGGEEQPITVLPAAARPARSRLLTATTGAGPRLLYVLADGTVYLNEVLTAATWVSLESLTYRL